MEETRRIYLVRHCEPQLPQDASFCLGKKDIPLNDEGRKQAHNLKKIFSDRDISCVYSSPLSRARETAIIIADKKRDVVVKESYSELNTGRWDGLSFEEIKEKFPQEYKERGMNLEHYVIVGGESLAACRDRAMSELSRTIQETDGNIVIVTHAGVIRMILSHLAGTGIQESFRNKPGYGSVNMLLYDGVHLKTEGMCI
ncbi:histidine phosphatase family protein [Parasporobacterium paucivorans]|uniref:Probable phosphoglycerate mutase n=1 Tax=Parasporobacterium paucivorans DSM 15970 TaxID=1122934 RepID=A0A1M6HTZ9_9FIRM|nr:histidine phosphatase family protein [Parasporobacterium paucivorans]SHJ25675.1 probable phosphoglycerate mutase [Parasporobacterium paucivorans DSM 15970]